MTAKITKRDIARLVHISKSTVSLVLNRSKHVDLETYEHVLRILKEQGFAPGKLFVVGSDTIPPPAYVRPAPKTTHQPFEEMGRHAAEVSLSTIDLRYLLSSKKQMPSTPNGHIVAARSNREISLQLHLPIHLVMRDSCGPPGHLSLQSITSL